MFILDVLAGLLAFMGLMVITHIFVEITIRCVLRLLGKDPDAYILQLNAKLDEMRKESISYPSIYNKSFSKKIEIVEAPICHKYGCERMCAFSVLIDGKEKEVIVSKETFGDFKINDIVFVEVTTSTNLIDTHDVKQTYKLLERGVSSYLVERKIS